LYLDDRKYDPSTLEPVCIISPGLKKGSGNSSLVFANRNSLAVDGWLKSLAWQKLNPGVKEAGGQDTLEFGMQSV
jgi:hypothetical protein